MVDLVALPPAEAIEYFRQKGFAVGFDHRDVWQAQHQAAFTVAKAMQLDILQDIRAEVDRALVEGTTIRDFQQRLGPTLQAKSWWGRKEQVDPQTGVTSEVQLGSPRRLKTIYDTNLRTAHTEGQWQRIQERKASFPYLQYDGGNSEHPRLEHSAWDGMVLPVDDPFWLSHLPIKAWGCKCRVIPKTASQVQRQGLEVGESPSIPTRPYVNARTGEVQQIPAGVDPAFHYPPGERRASLTQRLIDKLDVVPADIARASIADMVKGPAFAAWYRQPAGSFPIAQLGSTVAERLRINSQVLTLPEATLIRQLRKQPRIIQDDYLRIQGMLDNGPGVLQDDGSVLYAQRQDDGSVLLLSVTGQGHSVAITLLRRLSKRAAKLNKQVQQLLTDV